MSTWFEYLKRGLARQLPQDRLADRQGYANARANLQHLRPFITRRWRRGLLGALLILSASLLSFPQPLITRYLIDDVILGHQLNLLAGVVLLLVAVKGLSVLIGMLQQFTFARFEQEILLDIQRHLLERTLHFPKSFFDEQEVGYLMSRLSSDVMGLRWFFSSTIVRIATSVLRLVGGAVLLFYLEWRLALVALVVVPGMVFSIRYFSRKVRALSHHSMERQANVARRIQESLSSVPLIKAFVSEEREVGRVMGEMQDAFQLSLRARR